MDFRRSLFHSSCGFHAAHQLNAFYSPNDSLHVTNIENYFDAEELQFNAP